VIRRRAGRRQTGRRMQCTPTVLNLILMVASLWALLLSLQTPVTPRPARRQDPFGQCPDHRQPVAATDAARKHTPHQDQAAATRMRARQMVGAVQRAVAPAPSRLSRPSFVALWCDIAPALAVVISSRKLCPSLQNLSRPSKGGPLCRQRLRWWPHPAVQAEASERKAAPCQA
jgi:hypothetical protein